MKIDVVKDNRNNRWRKGISPVIATILIVILVIALVGIAWAIMSGFLGTASVKTDIAIEKLDIVANGMSVAVVRNVGNVRIKSIDEVTLTCTSSNSPTAPANTDFDLGDGLDPGKTATATWSTTLIPGETCTLTIKATAANGASVAASSSAIVRP
ncbi:MAG: archaellin/type IV pilin N-terminal domain-containing protein [Ignisphaera sp.]